MKILYTSDIHANNTHLSSMYSVAETEKVDCIIIGGDVVPHKLPNSLSVLHPLTAQKKYIEKIFIPSIQKFIKKTGVAMYLDLGNDDFFCNRKILQTYDEELFNLLHFKKVGLTDKVDIIGYMGVPPTPFTRKDMEKPDTPQQPYSPGNKITLKGYTTFNNMLEETIMDLSSPDTISSDLERLSETVDRPFIFVSHSPPYQTSLDVIYNGTHVGSIAIAEFIQKWAKRGKLIASFHGHIHESPVRSGSIRTRMEGALCFNPGQGNGQNSTFRYMIFRLAGDQRLQDADILKVGE